MGLVVYTKEGCPYCSRLLAELQEKGADYREVNISYDGQALQKIKEEYGADRVPVVVDGAEVTVGYQGGEG